MKMRFYTDTEQKCSETGSACPLRLMIVASMKVFKCMLDLAECLQSIQSFLFKDPQGLVA